MNRLGCVMILVGSAALAGAADAGTVYVPGHYLANGTYVRPHYRVVPDGPIYPGTGAVDPDAEVAAPVPVPYGTPYAPGYVPAPGYAPGYVPAPGYMPAPGYVPNYGYVPPR